MKTLPKKALPLLALLFVSSLSACVRARLPDGKLYTCAARSRPMPESAGPLPTFWAGNTQYNCLGPQNLSEDKINGQKETVQLASPTAVAER